MVLLGHVSQRIDQVLWEQDLEQRGWIGQLGVRLGRIVYGIVRKFTDGQLNLRAMSLVYTTLLSLVPLLAVSFSVLKAFGVHNQLEPVLMELLDPLGTQGQEVGTEILGFVENLRVGVLGSLGIAMLFYTVISLVHKVEQTFNDIWQVAASRNMARRFSDYLSVILIGPVLVFTAVGLTASAMDSAAVQWLLSINHVGGAILSLSRLGPYFLVIGAFAFVYGFIPNTRVQLSAALIGGIFAGVLWYTTGKIFANFVVNSTNYSAIYSGFASAILFMVWLYVGWLIVLVGGQVTFYWQNPRFMDPRSQRAVMDNRRREELVLELMMLIGRAHYYKQESLWTLEALEARYNSLEPGVMVRLLDELITRRLIIASNDKLPAYLPAFDTENITLQEVLVVARGAPVNIGCGLPAVDTVMDRLDATITEVLQGRTLKDLILEDHEMAIQDQ